MRVTNGPAHNKFRKKIMRLAKGYRSGRHKMFHMAQQAVKRAEVHAYTGRKLKKRTYRTLWITRLNIAAREQGISYSRLISGLLLADVRLDRKQLSELAIHQPAAFAQVVQQAKAALAAAPQASLPAAFGFRPQKGGKDDLVIIEGIGPKIATLLVEAGIDSFAKLAAAKVDDLKALLAKGGAAFNTANPASWPQQAGLAAKGAWAELRTLMDKLVAGVAR